ncbi:hypothetical protein WDU94_003603, partial [Cyamophila willieti]
MFTQLISNRISYWAEKNNIFPEEQAGFRKGRGCTDQIFILNAVVQLRLSEPRQKLYACFVDFKACFPSISHKIMWQKLFAIGIPAKLIRIVKSLYDKAMCRIRVNDSDEYTQYIQVTQGVMQGDSLSPNLFVLVVADIISFMENKGLTGVSLSDEDSVLMLLYADDLVILSTEREDLQNKIDALKEYCEQNELQVNTEKTKVVVFRRGGRLAHTDKFWYDDKQLDIVKKYTYLGVVFSSSGLYREHMVYALSKAKLALANIKTIMINSKMESWESRMVLYNTVLKVTLLYAAEVWSLRYVEEVEKCQVQFFKSILCLPSNTPNHYIRLEVGVVKLFKDILKQSI